MRRICRSGSQSTPGRIRPAVPRRVRYSLSRRSRRSAAASAGTFPGAVSTPQESSTISAAPPSRRSQADAGLRHGRDILQQGGNLAGAALWRPNSGWKDCTPIRSADDSRDPRRHAPVASRLRWARAVLSGQLQQEERVAPAFFVEGLRIRDESRGILLA